MKISFSSPGLPKIGVVVVAALSGGKLLPSAEKLDKSTDGSLTRAVKASNFRGDKGDTLQIVAPGGSRLDNVMLVGLGKPDGLTDLDLQKLGGSIYATQRRAKKGAVSVAVDALSDSVFTAAEIAAQIAYGARLRS